MRILLLLLLSFSASAQYVVPFAATRPADTSKTKGQLSLPVYATADTNKVLGIDATGAIVLRTKGVGGGGSGIQTVTATAPLTGGGTGSSVTVGIQQASPLQAGFVTATDYRKWDSLRAAGSAGSVQFKRDGVLTGNDSLVYLDDGSFYAPSIHAQYGLSPDIELAPQDSSIVYTDATYFYEIKYPPLTMGSLIMFPERPTQDTFATQGWVRDNFSGGGVTQQALDDTASAIRADYVPYTGAIDSVSLGENQIRAGQVVLDLTPTGTAVIGGIYWDSTDVCPSVPLDADVTMQIGQEVYIRARNNTGSTIPNGHAVYINGAQGNNPTIALADADSIDLSKVIGIATEDIADNATGFVTTEGVVRGVNTSAFTAGDALYLDTVAGHITKTVASSTKGLVFIGFALNSTNNGRIYVKPSVPISGDTTLVGNTLQVAPTQTAVRKYVQSLGYGTGTIRALTGDVSASGTGTVTATLATVNATPATYTNATLTVDSKGRVTSATSGTAPVTSVSGTSGRVSSTGGTTPVIDLVTVNATPATYGGASAIPIVTVDAYGRATTITTVAPATSGTVTSITGGFGLTGGTITSSGTFAVDSGTMATRARVQKGIDSLNLVKGSGTVTSIQVVGGTGVTVTPTTAVTTSGIYTVSTTQEVVNTTTVSATYTVVSTDTRPMTVTITSLNAATTFANPTGTFAHNQMLLFALKDNGTARALSWGSNFVAGTTSGITANPTTTTLGLWLYIEYLYNSTSQKWYLVGIANGFAP